MWDQLLRLTGFRPPFSERQLRALEEGSCMDAGGVPLRNPITREVLESVGKLAGSDISVVAMGGDRSCLIPDQQSSEMPRVTHVAHTR